MGNGCGRGGGKRKHEMGKPAVLVSDRKDANDRGLQTKPKEDKRRDGAWFAQGSRGKIWRATFSLSFG
jgi:hypothetical protein